MLDHVPALPFVDPRRVALLGVSMGGLLAPRAAAFDPRVMTLTWAAALLVESALRTVLVYRLPVDVMAGLSWVLLLGTVALLGVWSAWYGGRAERAAARHAAVPGTAS
ncbi:hypothetical protein Misp01_42760 [Microtetraspora sp. NBRC 13810]|uniref:hypothetical protein n=1 Tax=Microtetraspora sp. NBRC 13810 TaxID=3030990 RepID=UPI00249FE43B|nr:hypothetical protein [Microtetraspora sp. NBRC 13810]GLW09147.1 hypothetical protein Misp01_42760 [Microtetraspora sp. NBRC 13810]